MKINAKEERPKIHFLVILTIIAAALILYLIFWAREAHPIAVCSIAIAYFSAVVISLVAAFFRQIRFNLYSYNTVFYMLSKTKQQDAVISAQKGSYLTASAMPRRNRIGSLETSNHQLGWWWKKLIAIKILQ